MKALSFRDPWATLIALGLKDIENRTWRTNFRGRVYIHVSQIFDQHGWGDIVTSNSTTLHVLDFVVDTNWDKRPRGAIIGEVDIVDCVQFSTSLWFTGPHGLVLSNAKMYNTPILNMKGYLRFFEPEINFGKVVTE